MNYWEDGTPKSQCNAFNVTPRVYTAREMQLDAKRQKARESSARKRLAKDTSVRDALMSRILRENKNTDITAYKGVANALKNR
jgi:hypothetical protein